MYIISKYTSLYNRRIKKAKKWPYANEQIA